MMRIISSSSTITVVLFGLLCVVCHSFTPPPTKLSSFPSWTSHQTNNRPLAVSQLHATSQNEGNNKTKKKPQHDRTIDRRKSPALWRNDFEYSIAPVGLQQQQSPSIQLQQQKIITEPPELMSPAGGWPQLKAAVANGADAVYLGLTSYSARARASNFDPDPTLIYKSDYEPNNEGAASLAQAVKFAHEHHVRVYVAFNTLVFDEELHEVQELIEQIWECGVDAVIVQDVGVSKIVKEVVDALSAKMEEEEGSGRMGKGLDGARMEIHASTQQTVTCADGVEFAAQRTNATRVVLGRELSLTEIAQITSNTDIEIEAFVHGALCVSYSGQCFSSEAWGGRSANRGQCAQACRLPYGLIANGELKHLSFDGIEGIMGGSNKQLQNNDVDEVQYLLSPQDLCGLEHVEGLVRAGVSCLKIEGRLKDSSYVAATTRAYRQAIDEAWGKVLEEQSTTSSSTKRILSSPDEHVSRSDLTHVFARGQDENHDGLTAGFFEGPKHQRLVRGRSPRHRGVHLGRVVSSNSGVLTIQFDDRLMDEAEFPLKRGDGIVVDRGMPQDEELGGPIYDVRWNARDGTADIRFGREVEHRWMDNDRRSRQKMAPNGAHVWKTADSDVSKRMKRLAVLDPPKSPAKVVVSGGIGQPLTVKVIDTRSGKVGEATSDDLLEEAQKAGLSAKTIRKAIGTLGNSRWNLGDDDIDSSSLEENVWCPMSLIKETRRQALDNLVEAVEGSPKADDEWKMHTNLSYNDEVVVDQLLSEISTNIMQGNDSPSASVKVSVLARSYEQVDSLCSMIESSSGGTHTVDEIVVDFLEIDGIRAAVSRIREVNDVRVVVASPRIIKPGEEGIWRTLLRTEPDGIMIRSTGLLHRLTQLGGAGQQVTIQSSEGDETIQVAIPELIGDFSLNAANAITAFELLQSGLDRITAAYDLNANSITELATLLGRKASQLEVVVHQHMPIFHTEHCVFARFLSKGDSYQDCGHVCTRNIVHLRDQNGKDNLVLADMGCRNTVFQAESQSGVYSLNEWVKAGVGHVRIELVDEKGEDAVKVVKAYLQFLEKDKQAVDVWSVLEGVSDSNGRMAGVGIGSLRNSVERRSGEITSNIH
ncbi:23S rRNA 5-hydroxycytidine C2501 synthase [Skeletonema marinoi]|uniref:23S rRNA 5-hydroxycytidine C2501 synthase n=1 Tax=Skeletonema marinoi TaxID=267567 RepID=A0AAD8Y6F1_9STRA|nr:23S rRNA 5-hydroxycytidine C2501 synthase [Skeletonema marinoi]